MTVDQAFGGQAYPAELQPKIAAASTEIDRRSLEVKLELDETNQHRDDLGRRTHWRDGILRGLGDLQPPGRDDRPRRSTGARPPPGWNTIKHRTFNDQPVRSPPTKLVNWRITTTPGCHRNP
jgi:hypothetical protein